LYSNIDPELLNKAVKRKSLDGKEIDYNILTVGDEEAVALYKSVEEELLQKGRSPKCPLCSCRFSQSMILQHLPACATYRQELYSRQVPAKIRSDETDVGATSTVSSAPPTDQLVGTRIKVYWSDRRKWFNGTVIGASDPKDGGSHDVKYDDTATLGTEPISEKLVGGKIEKWKEI